MLQSYPKIKQLGSTSVRDVTKGCIVVEEKVDGSQFSFGSFDGKLFCRSKGRIIEDLETPDKLFMGAIATARDLFTKGFLEDGWTYRGEALHKEKHNVLTYGRVPHGNLILFDVETPQGYLSPTMKRGVAESFGLECVPCYFDGHLGDEDSMDFQQFLQKESVLGAVPVEGVVVKNYAVLDREGKPKMAKVVSKDFKEKHGKEWKTSVTKDEVAALALRYKTEARWEKAYQHLRDEGKLTGEMRDVPLLLEEIVRDIVEEEAQDIGQALFKMHQKRMQKIWVSGAPQWLKKKLAEQ